MVEVANYKAENYTAAYEAAFRAHGCHFGLKYGYLVLQDDQLADSKIPNSISDMEALTYKVKIQLQPTPTDPGFEETLKEFAQLINRNVAPGTHTVLSLTVWRPKGEFSSTKRPVQCIAQNCPVKGLHYMGLYMESEHLPSLPKIFGKSIPPGDVYRAARRLEACETPEQGDQELVDQFISYHFS